MARRRATIYDAWAEKGPLTDLLVKALVGHPPADRPWAIRMDGTTGGFGLRVTKAGAGSFILRYRTEGGRDRLVTIGSTGDWTVAQARTRAHDLRRQVDAGGDPLADRQEAREAPDVAMLAARFSAEHLPKLRPVTARDYAAILNKRIVPALGGKTKLAAVKHSDIDKLHREIAATAPIRANRCVAVASKMFAFAIRQGWVTANPCQGVAKSAEGKRERYLTPDEIGRLLAALDAHKERGSADAIRLLLLTGARRGETLAADWPQFDLDAGVWTKPSSHTKQKKTHRVPLSAPALELLRGMKAEADKENARRKQNGLPPIAWLFPSGGDSGHIVDVKKSWALICTAAKIEGCRLHDMRHSYASVLVNKGVSLFTVAALLGHTQQATTQRYAHLVDETLKAATELAGAAFVTASTKKPAGLKRRTVRST